MIWAGINNENQTNIKMMMLIVSHIDEGLPNAMHYCFVACFCTLPTKVNLQFV